MVARVADLLVVDEVDQREQRHHVLVVVDVREPLAEAGAKPQIEPALDAAARHLVLLAPSLARIREALVGKQLPGQQPGAGEENLMILGPRAHRVPARLVGPVLEREHRAPRPVEEPSRGASGRRRTGRGGEGSRAARSRRSRGGGRRSRGRHRREPDGQGLRLRAVPARERRTTGAPVRGCGSPSRERLGGAPPNRRDPALDRWQSSRAPARRDIPGAEVRKPAGNTGVGRAGPRRPFCNPPPWVASRSNPAETRKRDR